MTDLLDYVYMWVLFSYNNFINFKFVLSLRLDGDLVPVAPPLLRHFHPIQFLT